MMQRTWRTLLPLVALVVLAGYLYTHRQLPVTAPPPSATLGQPYARADSIPPSPQPPGFPTPDAHATLALIASGGPFPYRQDGEAFGNYEHLVPEEPRGYYHEHTVPTPGAGNRGACRIITGGDPPAVYYYTGDHYRSFHQFTLSQ